MIKDSKGKRLRRRTCADWMRRDMGKRRRSNPASKIMMQLLGLFSAALSFLPEIVAAFPEQERGNDFRPDRRRPPPDYELGPEAWARERGIEPVFYPINRPKPRPSWNRLVKDLNRRSAKDRAAELIQERVPPQGLEWLLDTIKREDWLSLRMVGHDRTEEEIRERALLVAKAWEEERRTMTPLTTTTTDDDAGAAAPPPGPKPRF